MLASNEVRLLLGVIAYNLGDLLRRLILPLAIQSWSLTGLQQRLFKTGGRLIRHARYFVLQLAESYLTSTLFRPNLRAYRATRVAPDLSREPCTDVRATERRQRSGEAVPKRPGRDAEVPKNELDHNFSLAIVLFAGARTGK